MGRFELPTPPTPSGLCAPLDQNRRINELQGGTPEQIVRLGSHSLYYSVMPLLSVKK